MKKILIEKRSGKTYFIDDTKYDFHCNEGMVRKQDLERGGVVKTNKGYEFYVLDANFIDTYKRIKRGPQIITLKDIGFIVAETGVNKDSVVLDAGTGSGALACFLAHIVKKVISYEIRKEFIKIAKENKKLLGLKNLEIKNKDVYKGIKERNLDLIVLDLKEPWKVKDLDKALKVGGFLVVYTPQITQAMRVVKEMKKQNFVYLKTIELFEREWVIKGKIVRPRSIVIPHTGFISFFRKIGK